MGHAVVSFILCAEEIFVTAIMRQNACNSFYPANKRKEHIRRYAHCQKKGIF